MGRAWPGCARGWERVGHRWLPRHPCAQPWLVGPWAPAGGAAFPLPAPQLGLTLGYSLNVSFSLLNNLSCLMHRGVGGEPRLNHGSRGRRHRYRSDCPLFVELSSLPGPRTHRHLLQRGALGVEGRGLPVPLLWACCQSPSRWAEMATLGSWRARSCGWGLRLVALHGAAAGYGLSQRLVSKGVGAS